MRRTPHCLAALAAAAVLLLAPARASADVMLTPFAGVTFFEDAKNTTFGGALTLGGLIGLEVEAARIQLGEFDEIPAIDLDAHATTFMGNFVVRLPTGPIQPYGTVGAGLIRVTGSLDVPVVGELVSASAQDFGWNIGGGLYLFPSPNFGIRGDIRHFRTGDLSWEDIAGIDDLGDIPLPKVDFWRATAGVTLKF